MEVQEVKKLHPCSFQLKGPMALWEWLALIGVTVEGTGAPG